MVKKTTSPKNYLTQDQKSSLPLVAIIGRPNVGKSTLFNRLLGKREAIVSKIPGTTRDRLYANIQWQGKSFILVDTGGIDFGSEKEIFKSDIEKQAQIALEESDLIIFLVDGRSGLEKKDLEVAEKLRKSRKKIILVVNKIDHQKLRGEIAEFYKFGLGNPIPISALHGTGVGDLLDKIVQGIKEVKIKRAEQKKLAKNQSSPATSISIAIIGRPNVGKSSIFNKLIDQERAIVSDIPGTTRDALDTKVKIGKNEFIFTDTAGIRRRGKINRGIEKYSVLRALKTIKKTDIVLLIIDAVEGLTKQDLHISQYALENYKGLILVVNKWDLVEQQAITDKELRVEKYLRYLRTKAPFLPWVPVVFTSALSGKNLDKLIEMIIEVSRQRLRKITAKQLNKLITEAQLHYAPKLAKAKNKYPRIYYSTQIAVNPPTFVLMVNKPDLFHFSYRRYLENQIRQQFGFWGTAIKIILRGKKEK